ncbi:MAG: hypothetical protein Kow0042_18420 [Calditrichia bacterium]
MLEGTFAQTFHWEVVTNVNNARDLMIRQDTIYAATSGGLVIYPISGQPYQIWTTEKGLSDQDLTALNYSTKGMLILGSWNGILSFINLQEGSVKEDFSLKGNKIQSIFSVEDTLWIACEKLVAVYIYDHNNNKFSFRDFFTNFDRQFSSLNHIYYFKRKIWVASDNGILYAPGNFLKYNLKSAANWKHLSTGEGLPSTLVQSINHLGDSLLIGTNNGLAIYDFQNITTIYEGVVGRDIKHIQVKDHQIYVDNGQAVYRLAGQSFQEVHRLSEKILNDFDLDSRGDIWIAMQEKGFRNMTNLQRVWFNGPVDNSLGEVLLDSRGRLWVVSGGYKDERQRGFSVRLTNGNWVNYRHLFNWRATASAQGLMEDKGGNIWIGSWNGGIVIVDPDLNFTHINNYSTPGYVWISSTGVDDTVEYEPPLAFRHFFSHTRNAPELLVVTDIMMDELHQSIWFLASEVQSGNPIVRLKQTEFNEQAYDSSKWERMPYAYNISVIHDQSAVMTMDIFSNIWIGTENSGVVSMQFQEDGRINWFQIKETDNLKNSKCWSLASDLDGYLWIGTHGGLNAYFNGQVLDFREDYQPIGLRIYMIVVDSENNKWFATDKGLSLLKASGSPWDKNSWVHFVSKFSEFFGDNIYRTNLPSDVVRSVYVDDNTGDVYCGTQSGLAILRSNPFTTPLPKLDKVKAGPVPLVIGDDLNNKFYFRNLTRNSEIKILTSSARLVRVINSSDRNNFFGSFAQWDGRNSDGRLVSSGVYLYLITDEAGNSTSGKLVVVRE